MQQRHNKPTWGEGGGVGGQVKTAATFIPPPPSGLRGRRRRVSDEKKKVNRKENSRNGPFSSGETKGEAVIGEQSRY